jgi:hypothetical protein
MSATTTESDDYERRRAFVDSIKTMSRPEFIEIARILRRGGVPISENRSGMFFDMTKVPDDVFAQLLEFHEFVVQNSKELEKRQHVMKALGSASPAPTKGASR